MTKKIQISCPVIELAHKIFYSIFTFLTNLNKCKHVIENQTCKKNIDTGTKNSNAINSGHNLIWMHKTKKL